jgi:hypothetical protein
VREGGTNGFRSCVRFTRLATSYVGACDFEM